MLPFARSGFLQKIHLLAAFCFGTGMLIEPGWAGASDKITDIPNLCQTDPEGEFAGDGSQFCAPVAISNSLMWLAKNGYPALDPTGNGDKAAQLKMVRTLASADYLDTDTGKGTNPKKVLLGLTAYLAECGLEAASLQYEGWRAVPEEFAAGESHPSLSWIKAGSRHEGGAVWLNVGWYRLEGDEYVRHGGHWVTLVGFGVKADGEEDPDAFIIHNPSPKAGHGAFGDVIYFEKIEDGTLANGKETIQGLPRPAKGYYQVTGALPAGANSVAILDGAIVLQMGGSPATAPEKEAAPSENTFVGKVRVK